MAEHAVSAKAANTNFKQWSKETLDIEVQKNPDGGSEEWRHLFSECIHVVGVDVSVTEDVDEFARFQAGQVSEHARQQGIAGDVEGNSQTLQNKL